MKYRIMIWGLGKTYNNHVNVLKYLEMKDEIEVVGVTVKELPPFSVIDGYQIVSPLEVKNDEFDYLLIMSELYFDEIVQSVMKLGIPRKKILPYRILELPNIDFKNYIELKESNLSIISNNCWGGIVYRTLGLECLSPFKNLFLEDSDYLRLLSDLYGYLQEELVFERYREDAYTKKKYPIMRLGDVFVHCNHSDNPEEAVAKWNARCKKVNYDNLFIEMFTVKRENAEKFLTKNDYKKKICFVPFDMPHDEAFQLISYPNQKEFFETVNDNALGGNNSLDYRIVDLLQGRYSQRGVR